MNSAVKHFEFFFNDLKLTIQNFRKFLLLNSAVKSFRQFFTVEFIENNFEKFLQSISLNKKFDIFSENSKKQIFVTKKKGGRKSQQLFQENPT